MRLVFAVFLVLLFVPVVFSLPDIPDLTGDGRVGVGDLLFVVDRFGSNDSVADVNEDGVVDLFDLVLVARFFGQSVELDPDAPSSVTPLFYDGFESGDNSHQENGYSWVFAHGRPDNVQLHGAEAFDGSWAHRFRQGDQQVNRYITVGGPALTESWFEYWIRIPDNYVHPASGNNKWAEFFHVREDLAVITEMWPSGSGSSRQTYYSNMLPQETVSSPAIVVPEDQGTWQLFRYYVGLETIDEGSARLHFKLWRGNELVFDNEASWIATGPESSHRISHWQIMGWNNAEFSELMTWYVDEVRLYDQDPGWGGFSSPPADTTPPVATITAPTQNQQFSSGTTSVMLFVSTNVPATCRWSSSDQTYSSMPSSNTLSGAGATSHSATLSGLQNGQSYTRYVRCIDASGNAMTSSVSRTFSVAGATSSPPSSLPPIGFVTDTFESGDFSYNETGFRWTSSRRISIVRDDGCVVFNGNYIMNCGHVASQWENGPGIDGRHAMRFRYPAGVEFSEHRFSIGQELQEVWFGYWLRVPINFYHPQDGPGNQKFFALWMDDYEFHGQGSTVTFQFRRQGTEGDSRVSNYVIRPEGFEGRSGSSRHTGEMGGETLWTIADRGRWMHVVIRVKAATSAGASDGVVQQWRRWEDESDYVQLFSRTDMDNHGSGWRSGYVMGWANSPYAQDTEFLIDDFTISTQSLLS